MSAPQVAVAGGLRTIRIVLLVLCVATAFNTGAFVVALHANSKGNVALCALRADLERRVDAGTEFLVEHPHGIPGISAKQIRDGIRNQKRTIYALRGLSCK